VISRTDGAVITFFALLVVFFVADTLVDVQRRRSWSDEVTDELDDMLARRRADREEDRRGPS